MINLNLTTVTRAGLNLLGLIGVVVALRWGESIFIPTVIALLLATILWPVARWLRVREVLPGRRAAGAASSGAWCDAVPGGDGGVLP